MSCTWYKHLKSHTDKSTQYFGENLSIQFYYDAKIPIRSVVIIHLFICQRLHLLCFLFCCIIQITFLPYNLNNNSFISFLFTNKIQLILRFPILLVIGGEGRIFVRMITIFLKIIPPLLFVFVGSHSIIYNTIYINIIKQPIRQWSLNPCIISICIRHCCCSSSQFVSPISYATCLSISLF